MKINFTVFILSLFIGLFFVYISAPKPNLIVRYPNVKDDENTIFRENNKCFKYIPKSTKCK